MQKLVGLAPWAMIIGMAGVPVGAMAQDADLQRRVSALETTVQELKAQIARLEGSPANAGDPSAAEEQAAANLLKEATEAAEALRIDDARTALASLKSQYPSTRAARAAQRLEDELSIYGKAEHPLSVERWFQGSAADLAGSRATLYVFWEVWCPHCKRALPVLSETYAKYHDRGLGIVGMTKLTRDVTESQVRSFLETEGIQYPIAKEESDIMSTYYGVRGIPAAAMVKDGVVVWRGHPARLTDTMIEGWLESGW